MAKNNRSRKRRKNKRTQSQKSHFKKQDQDQGFDFGITPKVMAMSDIEFNQALRDAEVIGCAYGYHHMKGISGPVPSLTLIGTNSAAFTRAYKHFILWGCEEDGDVVNVDILLKSDGSYDLWIGPEFKRSIYRTIPQGELFDVVSMNISWIKHIDSTSQYVYNLKQDFQSTRLHPLLIMAATTSEENIRRMQSESLFVPTQEPVPVPNWKGILKFELNIFTEEEASLDPRYSLLGNRSNQRKGPPKTTPKDLCIQRIKTLNTAFPVSRERIRRLSLINQIQRIDGFETVSEAQVSQAAINLMLSNELIPGDKHYNQVTGDYYKIIWNAITARTDMADGSHQPAIFKPAVVAHQIELDVWSTLREMETQCKRESFSKHQEIFRQKGYVND